MDTRQPRNERTHLTPPQAAARLGIAPESVLEFIRRGELRAANLGRATRPRWRISVCDLQAFLDSRGNQKAAPKRGPRPPKPERKFLV